MSNLPAQVVGFESPEEGFTLGSELSESPQSEVREFSWTLVDVCYRNYYTASF